MENLSADTAAVMLARGIAPHSPGEQLPYSPPHLLEFYDDERVLFETVARFLGEGLAAGESIVAIMVDAHREPVLECLAKLNIDVPRAIAENRLVIRDAREMLSKFLIDGMPDPELFKVQVDSLIRLCQRSNPASRVRAYGEMVDLLWGEHNEQAAIYLEELWNDARTRQSFSLLCVYLMGSFYRGGDETQRTAICKAHSHMLDDAEIKSPVVAPTAHDSVAQLKRHIRTLESELESRKQLEGALRDALRHRRVTEEALRQSNRDLDQFASVASHDLKAPLRGIANLAQWIEDDLAGKMTVDSREQMALLRDRVHKMEALIDAILNYSRVGRETHVTEQVDVNKLVTEVIELLGPPSHVHISLEQLPVFETERIGLYQVFQNLLGNAVKYTDRPDPIIQVRSIDEGEGYHFSVQDNGRGIPAKFHELIWQVFTRVESKDTVEGAGIGLSVVRKLVEMHGGRVWVESTVGHGSTFHFLWPKFSARSLENKT